MSKLVKRPAGVADKKSLLDMMKKSEEAAQERLTNFEESEDAFETPPLKRRNSKSSKEDAKQIKEKPPVKEGLTWCWDQEAYVEKRAKTAQKAQDIF